MKPNSSSAEDLKAFAFFFPPVIRGWRGAQCSGTHGGGKESCCKAPVSQTGTAAASSSHCRVRDGPAVVGSSVPRAFVAALKVSAVQLVSFSSHWKRWTARASRGEVCRGLAPNSPCSPGPALAAFCLCGSCSMSDLDPGGWAQS